MGYAYQLLPLTRDEVGVIYGSRDEDIVKRVATCGRDDVRHLLQRAGEQAWRNVLIGRPNHQRPFELCTALEAICLAVAGRLGEIDSRDVARVNRLLERAGHELELFPHVEARWPMPIGEVDDYPMFGWLDAEEVTARVSALKALRGTEELEVSALQTAQSLLSGAAATGKGVVLAFH